jgi:hypothetical protein
MMFMAPSALPVETIPATWKDHFAASLATRQGLGVIFTEPCRMAIEAPGP